MKGIDFLDVVGAIDERYILETEEKKIIRWNYKQLVSIAASFTLICTLSIAGYQYLHPTADTAAEMTREIGETDAMDAYGISMIDEMDETASIEGVVDGTDEINSSTDSEKNMFQKIIQNIVSFFKSLRF